MYINVAFPKFFYFSVHPADGPNLHQLVADVNDSLFARIQANEHHVGLMQQLSLSRTCHGLSSRRHNYTLNIIQTVTIAILLLGCYTRTYIDCLFNSFFLYFPYFSHFISCVLTTFLSLNEDDDDNYVKISALKWHEKQRFVIVSWRLMRSIQRTGV